MLRKKSLKVLSVIVFSLILFQTASCGTILYPERRGLRHGRIDPAVAVLDAVCLLFFLIPGVVAFAVDFATGAIYLPGGKRADGGMPDTNDFLIVDSGEATMDNQLIEKIILEKTGKRIDLDSGNYKTFKMNKSDLGGRYFSEVN